MEKVDWDDVDDSQGESNRKKKTPAAAEREEGIPKKKKKKQKKICDFDEDELLEDLNEMLSDNLDHLPSKEQYEQLIYLIERDSHLFPSKLQPAVAAAKRHSEENPGKYRGSSGSDPDYPIKSYYDHFVHSVGRFLYGYSIQRDLEDSAWHGPNIDIDTEDQLKAVIRLCPDLFKNGFFCCQGCFSDLLLDLAKKSTKAISFIPCLLEIYTRENTDFDLVYHEARDYWLVHLLTNERDEESLCVLMQLVEKGFIDSVWEVSSILDLFLERKKVSSPRDFAFIAERVNILVGAAPYILKRKEEYADDDGWCSLFLSTFKRLNDECDIKFDFGFYGLMLDVGFAHYPNDLLGLAFYQSNFRDACKVFGEESVKEAIHDEIVGNLGATTNKTDTLLSWIVEAASDESVDLDGLFTLIRFDPRVAKISKKNLLKGENE